MKKMLTEIKGVTRDLKKLTQKAEKLTKEIEKLGKTAARQSTKAKTAKKSTAKKSTAKKAAAKKPAAKKAKTKTATDTVLSAITRSKKGQTTASLAKKTGLKDNNIRAILSRLKKQGKIKTGEKKGLYVKA
ncbi:MAG: hypothetical protein K9L83_09005 [Deltaproteobacteria bacterium]|nr:hypothetical protein [Deltaproteobacteria bacterium]